MARKITAALQNIRFQPEAHNLTQKHINDFADTLVLEIALVAKRRGDRTILESHVREGLRSAYAKRNRKAFWKQWLSILGGALLGAFVQGFVTELYNGNTTLIAIYAVFGMISVGFITWSLAD